MSCSSATSMKRQARWARRGLASLRPCRWRPPLPMRSITRPASVFESCRSPSRKSWLGSCMRLLVTSAAGANGDGYGALLAFDHSGRPNGVFSDDARISDPRGLAIENGAGLLFLNSGADRVVALDARGKIVRDTGPIDGLNPGGGVFGSDHRYYVGLRGARDRGASQRAGCGRRAC